MTSIVLYKRAKDPRRVKLETTTACKTKHSLLHGCLLSWPSIHQPTNWRQGKLRENRKKGTIVLIDRFPSRQNGGGGPEVVHSDFNLTPIVPSTAWCHLRARYIFFGIGLEPATIMSRVSSESWLFSICLYKNGCQARTHRKRPLL